MSTLNRNQEEKLRRGLGVIIDETPPGRDLGELVELRAAPTRPQRRVGAWMGIAAFVGVVALFSPLLLMRGDDPQAETAVLAETTPTTATTTETTSTPSTTDPVPREADRFSDIQQVEETGDLIGLENGHAFISSDGGETWDEILVDGGADLIGVSPAGSVIAVKNGDERLEGEFGPDSYVWEAPELLVYDPQANEWHRSELPRPDMPISNSTPVPADGSGDCPKAGVQWHWAALSITAGEQIAVAGEHRIVAEGVCDQSFQFLWTSSDGETWTVVDDTGIDGYLVGLTWFDGHYVAYGSDSTWYATDQSRVLEIWTSTDLATWETAAIDLSVLPDDGYASPFPDNEGSFGMGSTVVSTVEGGKLRLSIPILIALPGPDATISSLDELQRWADENRRGGVDQADLDRWGIDFPLDEDEVQFLSGFFAADEPGERLILETNDGTSWTSKYGSD